MELAGAEAPGNTSLAAFLVNSTAFSLQATDFLPATTVGTQKSRVTFVARLFAHSI
jgi:hypothetical protein